jgi:hypothetical protein
MCGHCGNINGFRSNDVHLDRRRDERNSFYANSYGNVYGNGNDSRVYKYRSGSGYSEPVANSERRTGSNGMCGHCGNINGYGSCDLQLE